MNRWYVVTPEYEVVDPILDDGTGPLETVADVIEIEADTPADAKALGVKEMLRLGRRHEYRWCEDARGDGVSPYAGVKVFPVEQSG